jgi:hypothetical protein
MTATGSDSSLAPVDETGRARIQLVTIAVSVTFIVVGILGFIPGLTTNFRGTGGMGFSGLNSHAELFGVFRVSVFHNGVHLLLGFIGMICSFTPQWARLYLIIGGVVYLVLCIYGFVIDRSSNANFVPVNTPDNWLHLALGVAMIALGSLVGRRGVGR